MILAMACVDWFPYPRGPSVTANISTLAGSTNGTYQRGQNCRRGTTSTTFSGYSGSMALHIDAALGGWWKKFGKNKTGTK